jgi:predicted DNA-binding protein (UPF0251 family)
MVGFKPFGVPRSMTEEVVLHYDEFESIRLLDYLGLLQEEVAERMNVSRPTLSRIYTDARRTIAQALVEGKTILIKGGNVDFGRKWYRCRKCYKIIDGTENHAPCKHCTTLDEDELKPIE